VLVAAGWAALGCVLTVIPAAFAYRRIRRSRGAEAELASLRAGRIERPIPLVVLMSSLAVALIVVVSSFAGSLASLPLVAAVATTDDAAAGVGFGWFAVQTVVTLGASFLLTSLVFRSVGNLLGSHPRRGAVIAVAVGTLLICVILVVATASSVSDPGATALGVLLIFGPGLFGVLVGAAMLGLRGARRRRPTVVARLELAAASRAASAAADPRIPLAPQPTAPVSPSAAVTAPPADAPDPRTRRLEPGEDARMLVPAVPPPDPQPVFAAPDPAQRRLA
jgi:hypothetical protein